MKTLRSHNCTSKEKFVTWDLLTRSVVNIAEVHLTRDELAPAQDLLEAALAHPSILYEYGLKAPDLLAEIGGAQPEEKDGGVLLAALERHFDLRQPES